MSTGKKKKVDVWMPLYVTDYLGDTMHLSTEEHGGYLLLLMALWKSGGSISSDERHLRAITRMDEKSWKTSRDTLMRFFDERDGKLFHKRVSEEIATFSELKAKKSAAGKASAIKRKHQQNGNTCSTGVEIVLKEIGKKHPTEFNPSPSPILPTVYVNNPVQEVAGFVDAATGEIVGDPFGEVVA